ncbi:MAG: hypothetical protein U0935_05810 [Pirellulales bacterium]
MSSDIRNLIDEHAERALLAGCLLEPRAIDVAAGIVGEADFAGDGHGRAALCGGWRCCGTLARIGDPVVLVPALRAMRVPDNVTSPAFLAAALLREAWSGTRDSMPAAFVPSPNCAGRWRGGRAATPGIRSRERPRRGDRLGGGGGWNP